MKLSIISYVLLIVFGSAVSAQPMMRTNSTAKKLEINKHLFINKSLEKLLKEIGPEIKLVYAEGKRAGGAPGFFCF